MEKSNPFSTVLNAISLLLGLIFVVTGVLNIILVHAVPGIFYLLLSLAYLPNEFLKSKLGFAIPLVIKVILGFVVLWGTLAVGDLAEILGL